MPSLPPFARPAPALLLALTVPISVVELADLAGDWSLAELDSPVSLREIYFNTVTETSRTSANSQDFAQANEILTLMAGIKTFDDSHELICCVKTSDAPSTNFEDEADLQVIETEDTLILNGNSGENVGLQSSDSLGGWNAVEEASGTDAFAIDLSTGGTRFFRVTEQPEPVE